MLCRKSFFFQEEIICLDNYTNTPEKNLMPDSDIRWVLHSRESKETAVSHYLTPLSYPKSHPWSPSLDPPWSYPKSYKAIGTDRETSPPPPATLPNLSSWRDVKLMGFIIIILHLPNPPPPTITIGWNVTIRHEMVPLLQLLRMPSKGSNGLYRPYS